MTVSTSTNKSGPYAGSGTTGPFTVTFPFLENSHLRVIRTSVAGVDSDLALTTDYTVTGAGNPTGTVTLVSALLSGEKLTIVRNVPFTQDTDYVAGDAFPADSHERALDKLTMVTQQLKERVDAALTLPETAASANTTLPIPEANKLIGWNGTASGLQNIDAATLATIVAFGTSVADVFSGDGVQTQFTLTQAPGAQANLDVSIGGVTQTPGVDYTWTSGQIVTFTPAPPSGTDNILVRYFRALPQGASDAASATYTPAGTGAVATTVQDKLREFVSVKDFGAVGDGVTDDTAAVQAAFDFVRASGQPYTIGLGNGNIYKTTGALKGCGGLHLRGASIIVAGTGFNGKTFTNFTGGTISIKPLIYFAENDTLYNPSNPRRYSVSIGEEVTLNCNYNADYCVITDSYFDLDIRGKFQRANKWAFRTFLYGWGNRIKPYISNAIEGGVWLGDGCNGVDLDGLTIYGLDQRTLLGVLSDGNNNGIHWSGGFCEKVIDAVLLRNGAGPMEISGVDFEDITGKPAEVDGTGVTGRLAGPLTLTSCFLESQTAGANLVTANNASVIVSGCRGRGKGVNVNAFATLNNGVIEDVNNEFESTVTTRYAQYTRVQRKTGRAFVDHGYAQATNSTNTAREIYNYAYTYTPSLVSSGLSFSHVITDTGTQRMVGSSTWFVTDMSGGAESNRMGVSLAYTGGGSNKRFTPIDDNLTDLGYSTARWKVVYAGTGTINTSDEREKQDIVALDEAEQLVAKALKSMVKKFRFKDAVQTKGDDARIHIGVIAQEVVAAFQAQGLDPMRYGIICYDEWDAAPADLDENGNLITPARAAGNRYGVRYEELLAFIISAL